MSDEEKESYFTGVELWASLLCEPDPGDRDIQAKRYGACMMLQDLFLLFQTQPGREFSNFKALIETIARRGGL